jgi:hypothetical protein
VRVSRCQEMAQSRKLNQLLDFSSMHRQNTVYLFSICTRNLSLIRLKFSLSFRNFLLDLFSICPLTDLGFYNRRGHDGVVCEKENPAGRV